MSELLANQMAGRQEALQRVRELEAEVARLKELIDERDSTLDGMKSSLEAHVAEIARLKGQRDDASYHMEHYKKWNATLHAEIARLKEQLSSADEEMMTYFDEALDKAATEAQLAKQIAERKEAVRQRDRAVELLREVVGTMTEEAKRLMPTYVYLPLRAFLSEIEEG